VRKIKLPDFGDTKKLGKYDQFSHFLPEHRRMAAKLISIFMSKFSFKRLFSSIIRKRQQQVSSSLFVVVQDIL